MLEGGGSLGETGMHDKGFVGAVSRAKGGLPSVLLRLCGPSRKVHLGKGVGWREVLKRVGNEGERISVILGDTVETVVVYGLA